MRSRVLHATLAMTFVTAACAAPVPPPAATPTLLRKEGPMRDVRASTMAVVLKEAGLDPANLPPIETLSSKQRLRVMKSWTESLGIGCFDCHASEGFAADTRRKRVAKRMWNEIVRVTALETGEPVYCDSCHQGTLFMLDRKDKAKVTDFMSDSFVGKMKRTDERDHDCGTCHGDPPEFRFISRWKEAPAPDLEPSVARARASVAPHAPVAATAAVSAPAPAQAPAPTTSAARTTPAAAPAPALARAPVAPFVAAPTRAPVRRPVKECGDKSNLCPLQAWMRQYVAVAVAANDTSSLASALDRVAVMAPDPSWGSWREMSKTAAEAARRGDMAEARKSCQGCHNAYKAKWIEGYRARAIK